MQVPKEAKRHLTSCSRTYRWSWAHWCGCWGPNSNPLEEQHVLLTAEPPLQPPPLLFFPLWNMVDFRISPSQTEGQLSSEHSLMLVLISALTVGVSLWNSGHLFPVFRLLSVLIDKNRGKEEDVLFRDFLIHCPQCPGPQDSSDQLSVGDSSILWPVPHLSVRMTFTSLGRSKMNFTFKECSQRAGEHQCLREKKKKKGYKSSPKVMVLKA